MICGYYPFELGQLDDPMDIPKKISKEALYFPEYVKDNDLIDLITKLLDKDNPKNRLSKIFHKQNYEK